MKPTSGRRLLPRKRLPGLERYAADATRRILMRYRELIEAHRNELAKLITEEHGKTLEDAAGSVPAGLEVVRVRDGHTAPRQRRVQRRGRHERRYALAAAAVGCAREQAFQFTAMCLCGLNPVAIACGNTFVLKLPRKVPSRRCGSPSCSRKRDCRMAWLNVVHGDKAAVDALLRIRCQGGVLRRTPRLLRTTSMRLAAKTARAVQALGARKNHAVVLPRCGSRLRDRCADRCGIRLGGRAVQGHLGGSSPSAKTVIRSSPAQGASLEAQRRARAAAKASIWDRW